MNYSLLIKTVAFLSIAIGGFLAEAMPVARLTEECGYLVRMSGDGLKDDQFLLEVEVPSPLGRPGTHLLYLVLSNVDEDGLMVPGALDQVLTKNSGTRLCMTGIRYSRDSRQIFVPFPVFPDQVSRAGGRDDFGVFMSLFKPEEPKEAKSNQECRDLISLPDFE